jgi:hypothetical protein
MLRQAEIPNNGDDSDEGVFEKHVDNKICM